MPVPVLLFDAAVLVAVQELTPEPQTLTPKPL